MNFYTSNKSAKKRFHSFQLNQVLWPQTCTTRNFIYFKEKKKKKKKKKKKVSFWEIQ